MAVVVVMSGIISRSPSPAGQALVMVIVVAAVL